MCGIVAVMRLDGAPVDPVQLHAMRDAMFHRGPDDSGCRVDHTVGLAHRRLSILDLSPAGHQPLSNEDGTIWIVFNGEITNYVELRADLVSRGHRFSSHTDTEVIVHLYEEMGERCVDRLGGMFAFVLWDARRKQLFAARDRLGIKPLHYYADATQVAFASEVKALLAGPGVPRAPNVVAIADYMFSGFPLGDRTMFSGIRQLLPGHCLTVHDGTVHVRKYWDVEYRYDHSRSDADVVAELRSLVDDAVRVHCRSDAELGCHLSGGLDSSTVVGFASHYRPSMKTFSIRFGEGGWYDETQYAKAAAAFAHTEYHEAQPDGFDMGNVFPALLWHMEMPLPNFGGFSYYTVSRLASTYVKVTLTGHGGDELFGGYPPQFLIGFGTNPFPPGGEPDPAPYLGLQARATQFGYRLGQLGLRGIIGRLRDRFTWRKRSPEEQWVAMRCGLVPTKDPLLSGRFVNSLNGYAPLADYLMAFVNAPTSELFDRCLYHDLRCYLPGLLYMEDRVSMSVSVESRVPLLDHRLVEFMATVPPAQKVPQMQPKALLRAAARGVIPDLIVDRRDKRPFPVPFRFWIRDALDGLSRGVLQAPQSLDRGIVDPNRLRRWDLNHDEIWAALNVELWYRIFIDRDPVWTDRATTLGWRTARAR